MGDPTILNTLTLTTPLQTLLFDNASPRPVLGVDAQFYQPSADFLLNIDNRFIQTTSYVVQAMTRPLRFRSSIRKAH